MAGTLLTRRAVLTTAALATTTLAAPFVRGAYAAGKSRLAGAGKGKGARNDRFHQSSPLGRSRGMTG